MTRRLQFKHATSVPQWFIIGVALIWITCGQSHAMPDDAAKKSSTNAGNPGLADAPPNIVTPTAAGLQLWTDYRIRLGFRLQKNAITGHWRTIDDQGKRRAWGTRQACQATLDQLRPWRPSDDDGRTVTVLLHGLMRTQHCMKPLDKHLDPKQNGTTIRFGYASTRAEVPEHSAALIEVLNDLP
ncbi:MAG: hypothetical protein AAF958_17600, partial [Planctomycetota bacterium]